MSAANDVSRLADDLAGVAGRRTWLEVEPEIRAEVRAEMVAWYRRRLRSARLALAACPTLSAADRILRLERMMALAEALP